MLNTLFRILLFASILLLGSCATIVSKSRYPFSLTSKPSGAEVTVINMRNGVTIFNGETPTYVSLKAGHKYFKKARYKAMFNKDGYKPLNFLIEFRVDGWYIGNVLFGGAIGLLIVDPATGAMYKPNKEFIVAELEELSVSTLNPSLNIYLIDEVPDHWKRYLKLLK